MKTTETNKQEFEDERLTMEGMSPEIWRCGKCGKKFYGHRGCDCTRSYTE